MNFQGTILMTAIIILILLLIFIGIAMKDTKDTVDWPPIVGECPDYWVDLSGNGSACFNSHSLGKCNLPGNANEKNVMNFDTDPFNGANGLCSKYKWAKTCGITWDGITSGVSNPCDTTETTSTSTSSS